MVSGKLRTLLVGDLAFRTCASAPAEWQAIVTCRPSQALLSTHACKHVSMTVGMIPLVPAICLTSVQVALVANEHDNLQ